MRNAHRMHVPYCADQLRKVKVRNIFSNALVCLNLIKQISAFRQLHGYPCPQRVFARAKAVYDIRMLFEVRVQLDFHLNLLRRQPSLFERMFLIDEFDGDDRFRRIDGRGFADGGICALANGLTDETKGEV
jgi:hypothetical protein